MERLKTPEQDNGIAIFVRTCVSVIEKPGGGLVIPVA